MRSGLVTGTAESGDSAVEPPDALPILLRQVLPGLTQEVDHRLASRSLTLAKSLPLLALQGGRRHTITSIARRGHCDAGAMTRTIDEFEDKGLVVRERSKDDRRVVYLSLTPTGREAVEFVSPVLSDVTQAQLVGLSISEQALLMRLLRRVGAGA